MARYALLTSHKLGWDFSVTADLPLPERIIGILKASSQPLKATEICASLNRKFGTSLSKTEVNSALYGSLAGCVLKDDQHRWSCVSQQKSHKTDVPRQPKTNSSPSTHTPAPPLTSTSNESVSATTCPECGAPMKVKTAKKGPNAGGQFFGCSQWPNCKATLPIGGNLPATETLLPKKVATIDLILPRRIASYPASPSLRSIFVECSAVPKAALPYVATGMIAASHVRAIAQWELNYTSPCFLPIHSTWLTVLDKLLKRGKVVPLASDLESEIMRLSGVIDPAAVNWKSMLVSWAESDRAVPNWHDGFDSPEEGQFFNELLPRICGRHVLGWTLRQVSLDGLVHLDDHEFSGRRVDFLIAHPCGVQLVVEIDGAQHASDRAIDKHRDELLSSAGFEVIRIPAREIQNGAGEMLNVLRHRVATIRPQPAGFVDGTSLTLIRWAHQIQVALCHAMAVGFVDGGNSSPIRLSARFPSSVPPDVADAFLDVVLTDLNALISDLASLYAEESRKITFERAEEPDFVIDLAQQALPQIPTLRIRDTYLPITIAGDFCAFTPSNAKLVSKTVCERLLRRIFGFDSFREGQFEAVERCLYGKDAIVLLPTGAGKSVAFQLAALLRPGICIVIDPIVSLIEDQIDNLNAFGIDRICQITSALDGPSRKAVLDLLARGEYLFCYVAPERFQHQPFRESLRTLTIHTTVSLLTIDEAHCVSEWGHDFRPAYLNIARISRDYCSSNGTSPPIMALTGTASRAVLKDVQRELEIADYEAIITPSTFDRPELQFRTIACTSADKAARLRGIVEMLPKHFGMTAAAMFDSQGPSTHSGLIFCPHVNGGFGVVQVAERLSQTLNKQVPFYSGEAPKGIAAGKWQDQKRRIAQAFKRNDVSVMTCTKAFGMGIDKPNIRYTVHFGISGSIESFYQEAGRAGRDRKRAMCVLLYSNDDPDRTTYVLNPSQSVEAVHERMKSVTWDNSDDVTRALWFHTNAFVGADADFAHLSAMIDEIGDLTHARQFAVQFTDDNRLVRERAIHRLLTVGVVADYTVDYSKARFSIRVAGCTNEHIVDCLYRYIAAYQRGLARTAIQRIRTKETLPIGEFARLAGRELIRFVYDVIERSRRQALSEMLALCEQCQDDATFRARLLAYLGTSGFTQRIELILESQDGGLSGALAILEDVRSALDASQLRGESGRALESYPDHAALRLLRAASEAMTGLPDFKTVTENIEACVQFGLQKYGLSFGEIAGAVLGVVRIVADARPAVARPLIAGLINASGDKRQAARFVLAESQLRHVDVAVTYLTKRLAAKVESLLER